MSEQSWIAEAKKYIGLKEIHGDQDNPKIVEFWKRIKMSGVKDDETPWCAAFVGGILETCGISSTRSGLARSYENWGVALKRPVPGCVVVFKRDGGGHVGFVVGKDKVGNILVLGGNQGDAVNVKSFSVARVTAYRWPVGVPVPADEALPVLAGTALSTNEA